MAFAKYLAENSNKKYGGRYLKYDELTTNISSETETAIRDEFERVFAFIQAETAALKERLHAPGDSLTAVQEETKAFAEFIRLNVVGFKKALRHFDKKTGGRLGSRFRPELERKLSQIEHLDELVYGQSKQRLLRSNATATNETTTSFVRKTNKFWVHPDNLMALKLAIVRHLPLYVFSRGGGSPYSAWNHRTHDTSVTSVYLDNDERALYLGRMRKEEGAEAIRIRWYGKEVTPTVFIERKRHAEGWTGEESKKLRFSIPRESVSAFLRGDDVWEAVAAVNDGDDVRLLYDEVQAAVTRLGLRPRLRTFYRRVAFQLPDDAAVRISLDTNLCMIKEGRNSSNNNRNNNRGNNSNNGNNNNRGNNNDNNNTSNNNDNNEDWFRGDVGEWPFRGVDENEIVRFPHAVLEVKTTGPDGANPPWIDEIVSSPFVEHVHKFSKFLHGTALLYPVDEIPYWLPQMETEIRKDAFYNVGRRKEFDSKGVLQERSSEERVTLSIEDAPPARQIPPARISIPVRVEPKVFFANERTFLSWVQFAIFLGGIGTAMLGLANYKANVCGAMLIVVAIVFAIYALHLFYWRAARIRVRDAGPYDDTTGPVVLVGVFILALLFSVYFKFPMKKKLALGE
ncbi:polyphosphate synthase put [Enterospora canceri]|uniref:Polyphosphate synthase put n=1 Tax=Enterospora canceri TaxID=1081671 RepID=A0A1Y1S5T4_9MICR|nr:polyphosphate synthase put [Enterospora canceri]